jgi:hypothetical protein
MRDFLLVSVAKLVVALFEPIFDRIERRQAVRRRREMVTMPALSIGEARRRVRVKIAGIVEPAAACRRGAAFFVRDQAGAWALVQPAAAAAVWAAPAAKPGCRRPVIASAWWACRVPRRRPSIASSQATARSGWSSREARPTRCSSRA